MPKYSNFLRFGVHLKILLHFSEIENTHLFADRNFVNFLETYKHTLNFLMQFIISLVIYLQNRDRAVKDIVKYERKIQDLSSQCQLKTDECYEAWMSLTAANDQLEKLRMELDNKFIQVDSLGKHT